VRYVPTRDFTVDRYHIRAYQNALVRVVKGHVYFKGPTAGYFAEGSRSFVKCKIGNSTVNEAKGSGTSRKRVRIVVYEKNGGNGGRKLLLYF
jgi:hypothetical protein